MSNGFKRPRNSAKFMIGDVPGYIHDITTDEKECERTTKALAALEKQIAIKQSKLKNKNFITRAKTEIVDKERKCLTDLLSEQQELLEYLNELNETDKEN